MSVKEELLSLINNSYAPYSDFHVSSIVVMKDGTYFGGVNVENASYSATICAERVAITSAITAGYERDDFDKLYVMVDSDQISSCCFVCRQVISEFFNEDCEVIFSNRDGDAKKYLVKELCPIPFTSEDLEWKVAL